MGSLHRTVAVLIVTAAVAIAIQNSTEKQEKDDIYEGYDDEYDELPEEIVFNQDKPCPRDCVCERTQGYKIARCNRLEIGTQKFGEDITDLIVERFDPTLQLSLDDHIFKKLGLHQVTTIKISNTTINYISSSAFQGLHELYAVTLTSNQLESLHPETFAHNRKLILLTLSDNPLKFPPKGSSDYFLNSSSVQELDISNCNMRYIENNTFSQLRSLMYLNVAGNGISSVGNDVFRYLPDLEELDLSDNQLTKLPDDLFSNNTELATLHIQRNPIDTVYGLNVQDIVTLNAGQAKLEFIGPSMFNGLTYISNLNLSGNGIKKIHNQAFHKLEDLNYLDLSYNDLDFVSSLLIEKNNELDIFKISNNPRLKQLPKDGFNCSAEQFNIYLFEAANCDISEISDNALRTFPALTQINLSGNKLQMITDNVFAKCPQLVEINLANNLITALSKNVFAQNKGLSKINLRGNPLTIISAEVFLPTPKLSWLDLSQNDLISLWEEKNKLPTSLLNNLLFLNISNNNIQEIERSQIESINELTTLDVSNNPLLCNKNFRDLMDWVTKYKIASTARDIMVANLVKDAPKQEDPYSWDSLYKKTCKSDMNITKFDELDSDSASDEEIWDNMAEKNNLGDDDIDDTKLDDDEKLDDADNNAAEDGDYDDDDDDDMDINVQLLDDEAPIGVKYSAGRTEKMSLSGELEMDVKILEDKADKTLDAINRTLHGKYEYIWPILIVVLSALLLLILIGKVMMVVFSRRNIRQNRNSRLSRYTSAILAAHDQQSRTKKDCGLVYQQLSEEIVGPRFAPATRASHVSYETSPLKNSDVVPEAV